MSRFSRYLASVMLALGLFIVIYSLSLPGKQSSARAAARITQLPAVTCDFTVLNFNLSGSGSVGASRAISITSGDTFEQFIAIPITATDSSLAYSTVNEDYTGSVTGGVTGSFVFTDVNGVLVTNPEGLSTPRGFGLHNLVINGATGTITAAVALNFVALTSSPPYYPRAFNGYLHSIATTGAYANNKYNGTIAGTVFQVGNTLTLAATVVGRLYTGGGSMNELVTGLRSAPPDRATSFDPSDIITQFHVPDFAVGATAPGHVTARTAFAGTTVGTINGAFVMDHNAQIVDSGPNSGKGWLAGEFTFTDTGGNILTGPWLSDVSGNSVSGYVWQVIGTGIYTDSLLFGTINGAITFGGTTFAGTMSGLYCDGSVLPTATPGATGTPSATVISTDTPTPALSPTFTLTPIAPPSSTPTAPASTNTTTVTATPHATDTLVPTQTATSTSTPPEATSTPTLAPTAPASTPTATATLCPINFSDVHTSDYFYVPVQYLYCHGAISGYANNTFRPYNNTTRGQLSKIVVLAVGWAIDTHGGPHFTDVPPTNTFYPYIETAYNHGIISGYADGTFKWGNDVTRAQLSKIVVNAQGWSIDTTGGPHFTDVPPSNTFYGYIETAYNHRIISGYADGTFKPGNNATRGQISKIVYGAVTQHGSTPTVVSTSTPTLQPQRTATPGGLCSGIPPAPNVRITPGACEPAGTTFTFTASGFQAGESVTLWVTDPNGREFGGPGQLQADQTGMTPPVDLHTTSDLPTGLWSITFLGSTSRFEALGYFMLTP